MPDVNTQWRIQAGAWGARAPPLIFQIYMYMHYYIYYSSIALNIAYVCAPPYFKILDPPLIRAVTIYRLIYSLELRYAEMSHFVPQLHRITLITFQRAFIINTSPSHSQTQSCFDFNYNLDKIWINPNMNFNFKCIDQEQISTCNCLKRLSQ